MKLLFVDKNDGDLSYIVAKYAQSKKCINTTFFATGIKFLSIDSSLQSFIKKNELPNIETIPFSKALTLNISIVIKISKGIDIDHSRFLKKPQFIEWDLPDTNIKSKSELSNFSSKVKKLLDSFIDYGYLNIIKNYENSLENIINNLPIPIIGHDSKRKILIFNNAAEKITGYKRKEALFNDCHTIFENGLCSIQCDFCKNGKNLSDTNNTKVIHLISKSGEKKILETTMNICSYLDKKENIALITLKNVSSKRVVSHNLSDSSTFQGIMGKSKEIEDVLESVKDIANSKAPVLITGESGTGKELIARAIHKQSNRANKLFVPINCGALPENLLESELFGHVKGAFTGAIRDKKGRFELADKGTIFLDEIGDVSQAMQVKLLRVLQEGTFERVGSEHTSKVDIRVISATNKDLNLEISKANFREDLFYRLSVIPLELPPLRKRGNDILIIADYILNKLSKEYGKSNISFSDETMNLLLSYSWPGNIRELQNWIQFAMIKCKSNFITPNHLPKFEKHLISNIVKTQDSSTKLNKKQKLTLEIVENAIQNAKGNKRKAAQNLGIGRATLYRFISKSNMAIN